MYWLKRPHQCDAGAGGRRGAAGAPREWNVAYALGGAAGDETRDSELSELSDTDPLSETEPAVRDAASPRPGPGPRGGRCQEWRPTPGPPPGQGDVEEEEGGAPSKQRGDGEPKTGGRRRRKAAGRHWAPEARASVLRGIQDPWQGPPVQVAPADGMKGVPSGRAAKTPESRPRGETRGSYCMSEDSDINITSEEEDRKEQPPPGLPEKESAGRVPWASLESRAAPPEGLCCYICGSALAPASQHQIHVQKQEKLAQAPFFPFLWLHSPPPGAQPISEGGSTLVCPCCFSSLMQQWQSFELASVPVLQRLYVVPLNSHAPGMASKGRRLPREDGPPAGTLPEACYLCGEDCTQDARAVASRLLNGSARGSMHFPFLSLLPCPPNARGPNKRCEVRSCPKCFSVLEDVWALYRACQNEELITSVQGFLGRYHQAFSASDPAVSEPPAPARGSPASICYTCGAELGPGREFQLNVNPSGRLGEKEPFFPCLAVYPPAPRARPADSTGLVATCVLCYHDLLGQWLQHEARSAHHTVSPWSRQYQVDTFVCFFCQQEKKRCLGLKAVRVARLPLFLYTLRAGHSLLVDDGRQLIIGACVECGTLVCAGPGLTRQGPAGWSSPVTAGMKVTSASLEASTAIHVPAREPEPRPGAPAESTPRGPRTAQEPGPTRCPQSSVAGTGADLPGTGSPEKSVSVKPTQ
uniref:Genetic suppressor element 1 n=1 Tax=Mustela putorius furo TaxID=9669 RepID=M3YB95_MUSPF